MNRFYKVPSWLWVPAADLADDTSNPPTSGFRNLNTAIAANVPIKTFTAGGGSNDLCYHLIPVPPDIYRPDGIEPWTLWIPATGWSSGYYIGAINYVALETPFTLLSSGSWTASITLGPFTPSADGVMALSAPTGAIAVADDINFIQYRFYHSAASSTADTNFELVGLLLRYTAWRAGSNIHPGQRVA
jgi:hypothetical protein